MNAFLSVIFAIIGGLLAFFAIGWILMQRFYAHAKIYEKIIYSITLSMSLIIIISLILSYLKIFNLVSLIIAYAIIAIVIVLASSLMQG
jgi:hypothetical protein